jgi:hypothetical protein
MQVEMILMAARTRKMPGAKAKARREKSAEEIDKTVRSSDAANRKRSLPKINADLINEDDMTTKEETAAIMKLEEVSLRKFLENEPAIYTLEDLKVRYK